MVEASPRQMYCGTACRAASYRRRKEAENERNGNAKIIQARLGHSSYQVTMDTYAHLMSDSQIGAIEAFEDHLNSFEEIA